jgi:hypothetical protein
MTIDYHLIFHMETHMSNIMQAIVIFQYQIWVLFYWMIIHVIDSCLYKETICPLINGHQSFCLQKIGCWNDLKFVSSFWVISRFYGFKILLKGTWFCENFKLKLVKHLSLG